MPVRSLTTLLAGIVDYAGLFPPAALSMDDATRNYAKYLMSDDSWMLGRFITPVSRLAEFEKAADSFLPKDSSPWKISALANTRLRDDIAAIDEFNSRTVGAMVDTVEMKATRVEEILAAASCIPRDFHVFVEIPVHDDPVLLVQAIGNAGLRAKVRTGGVTADAFPSRADVARFIRACVERDVPFKATAGLHHPLRATYDLTYQPDSEKGAMFGYLNVFLAAAFMKSGMDMHEAEAVLEEESPDAFRFYDDGIVWRSYRLNVRELRQARVAAAMSFGSCSFHEPVEDLRKIHFL